MAGKGRPSRKGRSAKSNIKRIGKNVSEVYNKIADISAKTGADSGRFYGARSDGGDDFERIPLSDEEKGMVRFRARSGIKVDVDTFGSYRDPMEKQNINGTVRGRVRGKKTIVTRNPKRGFQIAGRTKVDHKDTRFYRNKKGQVVEKRKSGRTSEKDPVIKMLNDLRKNGVEYDITRVYSAGSRKLKGTQSMMALEISKPNYAGKVKRYQAWAYYDAEGKAKIMFESGGNSLLGALKGLDEAMGMRPGEVPLKQYYEEMTLDAQARVAEALRDVDWDEVFDDIVYKSDPDAGADQMGAWEARDMIRSIMDEYVTAI